MKRYFSFTFLSFTIYSILAIDLLIKGHLISGIFTVAVAIVFFLSWRNMKIADNLLNYSLYDFKHRKDK